jgi:methylenetetrahydrofolate dehydrogenase (NADP+)/methenyltetrahydrofolate cyclohydrolase
MGLRLEGKPVVQHLREDMRKRISKLEEQGVVPTMLIIRVGEREDDISYERGILKSCGLIGIKGQVKCLPTDVSLKEVIDLIELSNKDDNIHGIMLFRPLPGHLDLEIIRNAIDPAKDIDCMSPVNLEKVFEGASDGFIPCTAKAVIELLKYYKIDLKGTNIVVAGRSLVVGKPLAMLLLDENATVTICHSRTKDMPSITSKADVVVSAVGKAKFMDDKYFNPDAIVVDVGINDAGDGKICGDVDYDLVFDKVKAITPSIGGVGAITTTILLDHVVRACDARVKTSSK